MVATEQSNAEISAREVAAFKAGIRLEGRQSYLAYWKDACGKWLRPQITTWTGDLLAVVMVKGREYDSPAFGYHPSKRLNFRARGIDGRIWSGTYFKSSGDYVRMRPLASNPPLVPSDYPVRPLTTAEDRAGAKVLTTCHSCGRSWDDGIVTSMTPAPAARCPFEAFHK